MPKTPKLKVFLIILAIILIPYLMIIGNFRLLLYDKHYYQREFEKNNIYDNVPDADNILNNILNFFKGKEDLKEPFIDKEITHMIDVKNLISFFNLFLYLFIFFFAVIFYFLTNRFKINFRQLMSILAAGALLTILVSLFFYFFAENFDFLFDRFHNLFFEQGSWIFSENDVLIEMFPFAFFYNTTYKIMLNSITSSLMIIIMAIITYVYYNYYLKKNTLKT